MGERTVIAGGTGCVGRLAAPAGCVPAGAADGAAP
jgi:hypothetical protein